MLTYNAKKEGDNIMTNKEVIFNSLSFGNLILAKRLVNTKEIEKGHRNGPFLVLGRQDDKLVCLYATSKENEASLLRISANNYNLHKDTYITSSIKLISIDEFLSSIYYLNDKEKKNLTKFLYANGLEKYYFIDEPELEIGDIIKLKQHHLIIGKNEDNFITIKAEYDNANMNYNFDYEHKYIFPKKKYKRVAFLSEAEIDECIIKSKKNFNQKKHGKLNSRPIEKNDTPLKVGNLIIYDKTLYYLYYELGNKKLSFAVSKNKTSTSQEIFVDGDVYHANFSLKRDFDENQENVLFVATATEEEKKLIKRKRNSK